MAGCAEGREGPHRRQDAGAVDRGPAVSRYLLDTNAAADAMFRRRGVPERVKAARLRPRHRHWYPRARGAL